MTMAMGLYEAAAQAYERALQRAVGRIKDRDGEVHALDIGTGMSS